MLAARLSSAWTRTRAWLGTRPGAAVLSGLLTVAILATTGLASASAVGAPPTADRMAVELGEPAAVQPPPISANDRATRASFRYEQVRQRRAVAIAQDRKQLVKLAKQQVGDRYVAGASGPNAFDCSGLTRYLFKKVTGKELPHYSKSQARTAKRIPKSQARPGDLVFFFKYGAHHVGIYVGNGKMVHAVGRGRGVKLTSVFGPWYKRHFSGFGRVLPKA